MIRAAKGYRLHPRAVRSRITRQERKWSNPRMEFGLFYEIPVARPWHKRSELDAYRNTIDDEDETASLYAALLDALMSASGPRY